MPEGSILTCLSAAAFDGRHLWVAGDECWSIERLTPGEKGSFGSHASFDIETLFACEREEGRDPEIDIEGLSVDSGHLWVAGSHALKRKAVKSSGAMPRTVDSVAARFFLGAVNLDRIKEDAEGVGVDLPAAKRQPVGNRLIDLLADDPLIAPFLAVPAKENGFDIEGIAVRGDHVLLGLRGPVIAAHAVILSLRIEEKRRQLKIARNSLVHHLLDLSGLGVRDLTRDGDDVLILSGPSMLHDATASIWRWRGAFRALGGKVADASLIRLGSVGAYARADNPEAVEVLPGSRLLVLRDSPGKGRIDPKNGVYRADVFRLPM